jgi:hypothetical protein
MGHIKLYESAFEEEFVEFSKDNEGNLYITILNEDYENERFFVLQKEDVKDLINDLRIKYSL